MSASSISIWELSSTNPIYNVIVGWFSIRKEKNRSVATYLCDWKLSKSCHRCDLKFFMFWASSRIKYLHRLRRNAWWSWITNLYEVMQTWNALGLVQPVKWKGIISTEYDKTTKRNTIHTHTLLTTIFLAPIISQNLKRRAPLFEFHLPVEHNGRRNHN